MYWNFLYSYNYINIYSQNMGNEKYMRLQFYLLHKGLEKQFSPFIFTKASHILNAHFAFLKPCSCGNENGSVYVFTQ